MSDDFGFTNYNKLEDNYKLDKMYNLILPLLNNLMKNADKNPSIHWPNRTEAIQEFIGKLDEIRNS